MMISNYFDPRLEEFLTTTQYGYNAIELAVDPFKIHADLKTICLISNSIQREENAIVAAELALEVSDKYPLNRYLIEIEREESEYSGFFDDLRVKALEQKVAISVEKSGKSKFRCCNPECSNIAVEDSHALQRNKVLKSIADSTGAVYQTKVSPFSDDTLKSINTKSASTFPGYCSSCEISLFREVEGLDVELNRQNILLLVWRSLCFIRYRRARELQQRGYAVSGAELYGILNDHKDPLAGAMMLTYFKTALYSYRNARRWVNHLQKDRFGGCEDLGILALETPQAPIVGAGYIPLPVQLDRTVVKNVGEFYRDLPGVSYSTVISGGVSYIAFVYRKKDPIIQKFIRGLKNMGVEELSAYLPQIVVGGSDTVFLSKKYWDEQATDIDRHILLHSQGMKFPQMIYPFWGSMSRFYVSKVMDIQR